MWFVSFCPLQWKTDTMTCLWVPTCPSKAAGIDPYLQTLHYGIELSRHLVHKHLDIKTSAVARRLAIWQSVSSRWEGERERERGRERKREKVKLPLSSLIGPVVPCHSASLMRPVICVLDYVVIQVCPFVTFSARKVQIHSSKMKMVDFHGTIVCFESLKWDINLRFSRCLFSLCIFTMLSPTLCDYQQYLVH